jgi:MoaA/NifB/PqqE/SkfB family radical SAM enzyme
MSATSGQTTYELDLPQIVRIDPVHTCNLRCIMCHVSYMKLTKGQIPFETLRRLEPLANRNVWADVGCIFEPTAHSRFGDIMQLFNDFGFRLSMTTNGTLMTDRVLQQIAGINLRQVTISFDEFLPRPLGGAGWGVGVRTWWSNGPGTTNRPGER